MSDPAPLAEARELIRAGRFDAAVERLVAALPDLPVEYHRQACAYAGLAHYFAERWTESLGFPVGGQGERGARGLVQSRHGPGQEWRYRRRARELAAHLRSQLCAPGRSRDLDLLPEEAPVRPGPARRRRLRPARTRPPGAPASSFLHQLPCHRRELLGSSRRARARGGPGHHARLLSGAGKDAGRVAGSPRPRGRQDRRRRQSVLRGDEAPLAIGLPLEAEEAGEEHLGDLARLRAIVLGDPAEDPGHGENDREGNPRAPEQASRPAEADHASCRPSERGGEGDLERGLAQNVRGLVDEIGPGSRDGEEEQSEGDEDEPAVIEIQAPAAFRARAP